MFNKKPYLSTTLIALNIASQHCYQLVMVSKTVKSSRKVIFASTLSWIMPPDGKQIHNEYPSIHPTSIQYTIDNMLKPTR